jgi:hypothetical protein
VERGDERAQIPCAAVDLDARRVGVVGQPVEKEPRDLGPLPAHAQVCRRDLAATDLGAVVAQDYMVGHAVSLELGRERNATPVSPPQRDEQPLDAPAVARARLSHPTPSPPAECVDCRLQVATDRREAVCGDVARAVTPLYEAFGFHLLQSLGEKIGRDAGETAQELGVALGPEQEIADDEQRPALAQYVEGAGEAAVLVVAPPGHETIDL